MAAKNRFRIKPPLYDKQVGVFSTAYPFRSNPIELSILEILDIEGAVMHVKGLDIMDKTPILDIKPVSFPSEK